MSKSRPSSGYSALPPPAHSLPSCTPSSHALPPVLDIAPDLTLVKSTSDPYLSCSDLVPFTLHLLHRPCKTSSPFLLPLRFIFLYLVYFPVCFHSIPCCYDHVQLWALSSYSGRIAALQLNSGRASLTPVTVVQIYLRYV